MALKINGMLQKNMATNESERSRGRNGECGIGENAIKDERLPLQ